MESAQQLYAQRVWTRYMRAFREGGTDSSAFERQLEGVVHTRFCQLFALRSRLLQLTWCDAMQGAVAELLARCARSMDSLRRLDAKSSETVGADVPRSMYLRLMRTALLKEMAARGSSEAQHLLSISSPPFGSWTSAPACEDEWLDLADEVFDPEHLLAWEAQVEFSCG